MMIVWINVMNGYGRNVQRRLIQNRLYMKNYLFIQLLLCGTLLFSCKQKTASSQQPAAKIVGGGCEGCEAIYESPVPFEQLTATDTLPCFFEQGPKLRIEGTVYHPDGKTPAPGIILYVYHTGLNGLYENRGATTGWTVRHGIHRGWMKTDNQGRYRFYTCMPAPYPNAKIPAHIHPTVKEPGVNEYFLDDFVFDNDPLLNAEERKKMPNRGGNGILKTRMEKGMLVAERNLILGKNIPGYPKNK